MTPDGVREFLAGIDTTVTAIPPEMFQTPLARHAAEKLIATLQSRIDRGAEMAEEAACRGFPW